MARPSGRWNQRSSVRYGFGWELGGALVCAHSVAANTAAKSCFCMASWGRLYTRRLRRSLQVFGSSPEHLGDAPGLRHASTRGVRRVAIGDLRDLTQTLGVQVGIECAQPRRGLCARGAAASVHLHIRRDKRAKKPGPYRALVICAVAGSDIAFIESAILGILRRERAQ